MSDLGEFIEFMPGKFPAKATLASKRFEVRGDDSGLFDELVGQASSVHLEMMSDGILWMRFNAKNDDEGVVLVVSAEKRGKLAIKLEQD